MVPGNRRFELLVELERNCCALRSCRGYWAEDIGPRILARRSPFYCVELHAEPRPSRQLRKRRKFVRPQHCGQWPPLELAIGAALQQGSTRSCKTASHRGKGIGIGACAKTVSPRQMMEIAWNRAWASA